MLVVGIDPGSLVTGFSWIGHKKGKLANYSTHFKSVSRMPFRWMEMRDSLEHQLLLLPEPPIMVAIEEPSREGQHRAKADDRRMLMQFFGCYAVAVAEVSRLFRNTVIIPIKYMSWTGGLGKEIVYKQLLEKYHRHRWSCDDEADAIGLADFAWNAVSKNKGDACRSEKEILFGSSERPSPSPTHDAVMSSGSSSEKPVSPTTLPS
jgi:Holliday junction resolvasome RuvABC endonuclease subunit